VRELASRVECHAHVTNAIACGLCGFGSLFVFAIGDAPADDAASIPPSFRADLCALTVLSIARFSP